MKKYIPILFILLFSGACTKEATIKLPPQEEKLVVTCFISPSDTVLTAVVRTSNPKYNVRNNNNIAEGVTNAEVTIYSIQGSATFKYDRSFACYTLSPVQFPIVPGRSYSITVKTPDGKQSSASTAVPSDTLPIKSFFVNMAFSTDSNNLEINSSAEIAALPGRSSYVGIYYRQTNYSIDTTYQYDPYENRGNGIFEDDEKAPRNSFVFQQQQGSYVGNNVKLMFDSLYAEFWALNCSKEFYRYNRSVQLASENNGNPFGDPVMVYTNMDKGFGCFGAYMITKRGFSFSR